jgi:allantoin racemase
MPVVGMTEAGLLVGATVASRMAVLTCGQRLVPVYRELVAAHGMADRVCAVAAIDATAEQTFSDPAGVQAAVLAAALQLVDQGAEAVLLAGAAMAAMAPQLQPRLPVPLLDGVACAVALAEALAGLQLPKARRGSVGPTGGRVVQGVSPALQALFARGG